MADAEVRAEAEREVVHPVAVKVEDVGVIEAGLIPIRRADDHRDLGAGRDHLSADHDVRRGQLLGHVEGRDPAQPLVHGRGGQAHRVGSDGRRLLGTAEQSEQGVRRAVGGLLESADDHRADRPHDLVGGAGLPLRQAVVDHVVEGASVAALAQLVDPAGQVLAQLRLDDRGVGGDGRVAAAQIVEVGGETVEPAQQRLVGDAEAQDVADRP